MLYLKGQCSEVISPSLVMMPSPKYSNVITHTQRGEEKISTGNNTHLLKPEIYTSSCFQRGKKCSHHKCKKGTMQARWNTVYIMYHKYYFMLYFPWFKNGTDYSWFSILFPAIIYHAFDHQRGFFKMCFC